MTKIERLPIDSDLLQTFVRIAECGNLTLAASRLGRTQSAISVQLRKLENNLGATLFVRTARGMTLTPAGEALFSRAQSILAEIREASNLFLESLSGLIRVGMPDDFDDGILENILIEFARSHPGVQVVARSGCTSGYAAAVNTGELDIAVCSGLDDPGGEALDVEPVVWAARKGKTWPNEEAVPLAILDRPCYWRDLPMKALDAIGREHRVAFRSSSFTGLQSALRAGLAVGLLPESCIGEGLIVLTKADGFPELPVSRRSILMSENASQQLTHAMAEAIRSACLR